MLDDNDEEINNYLNGPFTEDELAFFLKSKSARDKCAIGLDHISNYTIKIIGGNAPQFLLNIANALWFMQEVPSQLLVSKVKILQKKLSNKQYDEINNCCKGFKI